jgi:hypothetical protein
VPLSTPRPANRRLEAGEAATLDAAKVDALLDHVERTLVKSE